MNSTSGIPSTPTGIVYLSSLNRVCSEPQVPRSSSHKGKECWVTEPLFPLLPEEKRGYAAGVIALPSGPIFVGRGDHLIAITPENGQVLWRETGHQPARVTPLPDGNFACLESKGKRLLCRSWQTGKILKEVAINAHPYFPLLLVDDTLIIQENFPTEAHLSAYDKQFQKLWEIPLGNSQRMEQFAYDQGIVVLTEQGVRIFDKQAKLLHHYDQTQLGGEPWKILQLPDKNLLVQFHPKTDAILINPSSGSLTSLPCSIPIGGNPVVLSLPSGSFEVVCETNHTYHGWGDYTHHIVKLDAKLQEMWRIDDTRKPHLMAADSTHLYVGFSPSIEQFELNRWQDPAVPTCYIRCFDLATGKEVYKLVASAPLLSRFAIGQGKVFAFWDNRLHAID
jgi:PQQ-like domain